MATEKATDTTATQNPAAPGPKTPARARAPRARTAAKASTQSCTQTSTPAPDAALTTAPAAVAAPARKSPRARAKKSQQAKAIAAPNAAEAEVLGEAGAALDRALLEQESSKSLGQAQLGSTARPACKAHCGQCGREMRFVPFALSNLMCRSCYGLDRYRRPTSPSLSSLTAPRPSGPR